jgi:LmbE family N-acetylglucosaminyl deacetylase
MGTLVLFHAHPDDEIITNGGTAARASAEGHRVVLVIATHGEWGESPEDLAPGETLVDRRRAETEASAAELGIHRIVWLGYEDSGMTGWEQNNNLGNFLQAPLEEAAQRLYTVLAEESADVLMIYDWHGVYGHPDHVRVHQVGVRAAELAGTPRVFEATMNRDWIKELQRMARESGAALGGDTDAADFDPDGPSDDGNPFGSAMSELTMQVDVGEHVKKKRAAMACHRSQISDTSFFLQMPDDMFARAFSAEWFIERGITPEGPKPGWIF